MTNRNNYKTTPQKPECFLGVVYCVYYPSTVLEQNANAQFALAVLSCDAPAHLFGEQLCD